MAGPRVPEGPPPAPVVQRLRLRYAKRGRLRFSSTRDFQRALERALRRADVPMAFSAGFHPHPRISYANAAPTGTASEAEYVELALCDRVDPEALRAALDEALPAGLDVLQVVEASAGSLADRLEASDWVIVLRGVAVEVAQPAVDAYLAVDRAEVTRTFKTGPRTFDTRAAVLDLRVVPAAALPAGAPHAVPTGDEDCAIIRVVVRHTTPAVRPDDILTALRAVADLVPPAPPLVTRLAQGPLVHGVAVVADPLATDEKVGGS
jgi:radical SAM-linked protein